MVARNFSERVEHLLLGGRESEPRRPDGRELLAEALAGGAFLVTAVVLSVLLPAEGAFSIDLAVVFAISYALMSRIRFEIGAGYTVPTQLVFVPMLFALPAPAVPLVVAVGLLLSDLPDFVSGRRHPLRAMQDLGDSWYAIGPAFLLAITGSDSPAWSDWPIYIGALAAQLTIDFAAGAVRERIRRGVDLGVQLRLYGWVSLIDVLLSPVGLLAAFVAEDQPYAFLLLLPLAALFGVFAQEHRARIESALGLSRAYREKAELNAQLLETERAATKAREELIAGASHEMQTPLAVLVGLLDAKSRDGTAQAQDDSLASMRRQATRLRHLVRQFIDYTRLKSGRPLCIDARPSDLTAIVEEVADAQRGYAAIELDLPDDLPFGMVDPDSLHQILMNLVSNAVKFSAAGSPTTIAGRSNAATVEISVIDRGMGIGATELVEIFKEFHRGERAGEGAGLGLYMVRELSEPQGVHVTAESNLGEGSRFTVTIPRQPLPPFGSEPEVTNRTLAVCRSAYAATRPGDVAEGDLGRVVVERTIARLEESNRELEQFATVASHDLQEPLQKIQMFRSLLAAKYADILDESGRRYLERMENATVRMQALIDNLLALSRVTSSARPFTEVDLTETARDVVSDLEFVIEQSNARVEIANLPTVTGDSLQLRQLLQNLIGNAVKFACKDSPPIIKLHARPASTGNGNGVGASWSIVIEDNGIGFEPKYRERIFQPFERLHGVGDYEGTGIGLAICRKIAKRHGGEITAAGAPGRGSTFIVTLPR